MFRGGFIMVVPFAFSCECRFLGVRENPDEGLTYSTTIDCMVGGHPQLTDNFPGEGLTYSTTVNIYPSSTNKLYFLNREETAYCRRVL